MYNSKMPFARRVERDLEHHLKIVTHKWGGMPSRESVYIVRGSQLVDVDKAIRVLEHSRLGGRTNHFSHATAL